MIFIQHYHFANKRYPFSSKIQIIFVYSNGIIPLEKETPNNTDNKKKVGKSISSTEVAFIIKQMEENI